MLETNYRSDLRIIDSCNRLIGYNYQSLGGPYEERFRKHLVGRNDAKMGGGPTFEEYADVAEEAVALARGIQSEIAEGFKPGDFFVGARTRAQLGYLEGPLMAAGIPFVNITGGSFWQMKHIQDVFCYARLAANSNDNDAFMRIYNIGSEYMTHPWGEQEGDYCTHRYLGKQFLSACENKYSNVRRVGGSRRSWAFGAEDLVSFVSDLRLDLEENGLQSALQYVIDHCYAKWLRAEEGILDSSEPDEGKLGDLQTLIDVAGKFETIEQMLDFVEKAIQAAEDAKTKKWDEYVVLSTIHRLKGLERPIVYGVGWSEGQSTNEGGTITKGGLLPHTFSLSEPPQVGVLTFQSKGRIEDERCMAFVLISRAQKRCHLSGIQKYRKFEFAPSRFLYEAGIL